MKVVFADSFFQSIDKIISRERWYWKVYDFFRYNLPWLVRNIYNFRKELYNYRTWDSAYNLRMLARSIQLTSDAMNKYSNEESESLLNKIIAMNIVVELLNNFADDKFIELAEKELGVISPKLDQISHNDIKVFQRANEIEKESWEELWSIIKGKNKPGTDLRGWWH